MQVFRPVWRTGGFGRVAPHCVRRTQQVSQSRTTLERFISSPCKQGTYGAPPVFVGFVAVSLVTGRRVTESKNAPTSSPGHGDDGKDALQNRPTLNESVHLDL